MDKDVLFVLDGTLAEVMESVDPIPYARYMMWGEDGKKIIHVNLNKALYGCLLIALLLYRKLRGELEAYGLVVNPYDPW